MTKEQLEQQEQIYFNVKKIPIKQKLNINKNSFLELFRQNLCKF